MVVVVIYGYGDLDVAGVGGIQGGVRVPADCALRGKTDVGVVVGGFQAVGFIYAHVGDGYGVAVGV